MDFNLATLLSSVASGEQTSAPLFSAVATLGKTSSVTTRREAQRTQQQQQQTLEARLRASFVARCEPSVRRRCRSASNTVTLPEHQMSEAAFHSTLGAVLRPFDAARVRDANLFSTVRKFGARRIGYRAFVEALSMAATIAELDNAELRRSVAALNDNVLAIALAPPPLPSAFSSSASDGDTLTPELMTALHSIFLQFACYGRSAAQTTNRLDAHRFKKLCSDCALALPTEVSGVRNTAGGAGATTYGGAKAPRALLASARRQLGDENSALALVNQIDNAEAAERRASPADAPRRLPQVDLDLLFTRCKSHGERTLSFDQFVDVLRLFAERFGDGVERVAAAIVTSGPPSFVGCTRAEYSRFHYDLSTYTGTARLGGPQTDDSPRFREFATRNEAIVERGQQRRDEQRELRREAAVGACRSRRDAHLAGASAVERWRAGRAALADAGLEVLRDVFNAICIGEHSRVQRRTAGLVDSRGGGLAVCVQCNAGKRNSKFSQSQLSRAPQGQAMCKQCAQQLRISASLFLHKFVKRYSFLGSGPYSEPDLRALFNQLDVTGGGRLVLADYDTFRAPDGGVYERFAPERRGRFAKLVAYFESMRATAGGAPALRRGAITFSKFNDDILALTMIDTDLLFKKVAHEARRRFEEAQYIEVGRLRFQNMELKDKGAPSKSLMFDDFLTACVGVLEVKGMSPAEFVAHISHAEEVGDGRSRRRLGGVSRERTPSTHVAPPWSKRVHADLSGTVVHVRSLDYRSLAPAVVIPSVLY